MDYLFVYGGDASNPRVRDEGLALLKVLEPAFRAGGAMARMRSSIQGSLITCLDALPGPVALMDRSGRYVHQNTAWRQSSTSNGGCGEVDRAAMGLARSVTVGTASGTGNGQPLVPARVPCAGWLLTATRFEVPGHAAPLALLHAESRMPIRTDWLARAVAAGLPPRLAQVAALIAVGQGNQEIAHQMRIRPATARRHTERVLARLGVSRRSAVAAALDATTPLDPSRE
jgi:DNA-binding CsgD family transcriptional regulator